MRNTVYILLFTLSFFTKNVVAQDIAEKNHYLLDSLDFNKISPDEKIIIDSCLTLYHNTKEDTSKFQALNYIIENCWSDAVWQGYNYFVYSKSAELLKQKHSQQIEKTLTNIYANSLSNYAVEVSYKGDDEKALEFLSKAQKLYEKTDNLMGKAYLLHNIGFTIHSQGKTEKAVEMLKESLTLHKQLKNNHGIGYCLNNIGFFYKDLGKLNEALDYFHQSLDLRIKEKDVKNMATCYNNIAYVHMSQGENEKAIEYFEKCMNIYDSINKPSGKATAILNLASIYKKNNEVDKAMDYYQKAFELYRDAEDPAGEALTLSHISSIYQSNGDLDKAIEKMQESLIINERIKSVGAIANNSVNIGRIMFLKGQTGEAKKLGLKALKLGQELGYPSTIKTAAHLLFDIYKSEKNGMKALEMHELYIQMRDSLKNENSQQTLIKQQAKYEYESKKTINDAKFEKQIAIEKEEKAKQKVIIYSVISGLILLTIFLIFVFNRLQLTRRQKNVIEKQKVEVEDSKKQLEQKNKEITDSIQYAKRIQSAILPSDKLVKEYLQNSFILYKPKDIVAGDFYWMESVGNKILFAAADCTGHGVPGAMVSVVCNNGLNRSVREYGLTDPGKILDKTREIVVNEFKKSEEDVKDGMDIALCSLEGSTLQYAGANNPLWIIRNGELLETKADKQPIGQFDSQVFYTSHTIELQKGDSVYLFSDGYIDQFGGEKGKKFKSKPFKNLLLSIADRDMEEQRTLIDNAFTQWKGDIEQVDDVCVIGFKI
ncbi:MAG: tetratricopeptide repeat protein [Vicingaceae bacterium]|nr:tetratricopeptide repeat protein [Vicingaceae bacterium]